MLDEEIQEKLQKLIRRHLLANGYRFGFHAEVRATERGIPRSLVVQRIRSGEFEVIEIQTSGKYLLYLGEITYKMPPVHATVALEDKLFFVNVQYCDFNYFLDDCKTRRPRRGR